jgi:hypothetical protein
VAAPENFVRFFGGISEKVLDKVLKCMYNIYLKIEKSNKRRKDMVKVSFLEKLYFLKIKRVVQQSKSEFITAIVKKVLDK